MRRPDRNERHACKQPAGRLQEVSQGGRAGPREGRDTGRGRVGKES